MSGGGGGYDISGAISSALSQFLSGQFSNTDNSVNAAPGSNLSNNNPWAIVVVVGVVVLAVVAIYKIFKK